MWLPDSHSIIIGRISIEVPTMPILAGTRVHHDLPVHILIPSCCHPPIDLDCETLRSA